MGSKTHSKEGLEGFYSILPERRRITIFFLKNYPFLLKLDLLLNLKRERGLAML